MSALTGFMGLLRCYSGQSDIAVGTFFAGRRSPESEQLIGMILNNVVVRVSLDSDPTAGELLDQVRQRLLEAADHQDAPFERVVDAAGLGRDLSCNPLFQVAFSLHDEPMPEKGLPGIEVDVTPVISNGSAKFDLGVILVPHSAQRFGLRQGGPADGLTMIWEYCVDLFDEATIQRMIGDYVGLLEAMAAAPDRRMSALLAPLGPDAPPAAGDRGRRINRLPRTPQPRVDPDGSAGPPREPPTGAPAAEHGPADAPGNAGNRRSPIREVALLDGGRHTAPCGEVERLLVEVWREVLGLERVGVDDDFFALGGHSLLAIQVVSRLQQRCGVVLPVSAVFECPSIAQLAVRIAAAGDAATPAKGPADR